MKILTEVFSGLILTCFSAGAFISCTSTKKAESLPKIDMTAWNYNEEDDVYYQLGIQYVANPADTAISTEMDYALALKNYGDQV